ncbi:Mobile element protein [Candidatus Enterovibrio escicola]|uniref:Mobile element protein n=2 Tax=Candidatus Enterovibrio escicola TaxID=1927127 RepID=A0A2A5T222_9GAMM|nr:transposase [Candidatus Enterovibrio escacola]PCS22209.1 Mobile element protein [Candidatus Enterovibrio escacola]
MLFPHSPSGIAFVDSSKLQVCHNLRILRHQVFKGTEKRGKGTMGWFYGFKLHFIINDQGGIISVKVTTVNVADRNPLSGLMSFGGVYTEIKVISLIHWSGKFQIMGDTDNWCVKKHEIKGDETLEPLNAPETIYYRNRFGSTKKHVPNRAFSAP